jgi:predicted PhzF superfamily epimerase YddE/YHI9
VSQPIYIVDAFATEPFTGNPAAVVPLSEPRPDQWMQAVAAEMNLSETAFIETYDLSSVKPLRWFTPTAEVALCGHATLAAAHVLGGSQTFSTQSGELRCTTTPDGWIEMDLPADPPVGVEHFDWSAILPSTTILSTWKGVADYLVELPTADDVLHVSPDLAKLAEVQARGLIVTAPSDFQEDDFVSRCFYPAVGVPEDPVTGSAHCTLASWWSHRLQKSIMTGVQLSQRTGRVKLEVQQDRVRLGGRAVTVLSGSLSV